MNALHRIARFAATFLFLGGMTLAVAEPRVVVLGFDGVAPKLVDKLIEQGELPNLAKLQQSGTYSRLESTIPPQSPSAWSSFATSTPPQEHGIFDFLGRSPKGYGIQVGFGDIQSPTFDDAGRLVKAPAYHSTRVGDAFWLYADQQGKRCKVLNVPFAFPPDELQHGMMISGLGVPDIRETQSWSFFLSDSFTDEQLTESISGGTRVPIQFKDNKSIVRISAVKKPTPKGQPTQYSILQIPMKVDREAHTLTLQLFLKTLILKEHTWSEWVDWDIPVTPYFSIRAVSRFYVLEAGAQVRVYMTCLQFDPREPYMRFSTPADYAASLVERYGLFKTVGWDFDTHALREGGMTEEMFLEDVATTMAWRERLVLDEIDRGEFDILVAACTGTDRVAHMFWRFRDPKHPLYTEEGAKKFGTVVEDTYKHMDETVGKVVAKLAPDDLLLIISDHGFHSFRVGFNVNTWLVRNGYLAVKGQTDPALASKPRSFDLNGYDWTKSKAYGLTLGGIFINQRGREGGGIVAPEESVALMKELKDKLLQVTYPETNEKVFDQVYTRDEMPVSASENAPDIQLGFADGFQVGKKSSTGAAPVELFELNNDKWSGEHAASSRESTPGILFSNKPLPSGDGASILDIGPTALAYTGCPPMAQARGKSLVAAK